jgi:flagellar hook-associated protein 1 FlgK
MSLSQALATAVSGLRAAQQGLSLVSSNIANAHTPGYVRKALNQVQTDTGDVGSGVNVTGINRELDTFLQNQIRTEQSGASFADLQSSILGNLQSIFGTPGGDGTLESAFNGLTTALQALSTSTDSQSTRLGVVQSAQALARQLNSLSQGVQSLRGQAESGIKSSVDDANQALVQINKINNQLKGLNSTDGAAAALQDQRDQYIDQLSSLMDVRVVNNGNQVSVFTNSGVELVGSQLTQLSFNAQTTVTATSLWNADPTKSGVGTLKVNFPDGSSFDLLASNSIRSGAIASYVQLRDQTLVQAQTQLDQVAANMASLLSDKTVPGQPVAGPPSGFDVDLSGLQNGNVVHLTYTDAANVTHKLSLVSVNDPSVLPLNNNATADPNDEVVGIDFSGGLAGALPQINAALGAAHLTAANPTGSTLRVVDDGTGAARLTAASATVTATTLQSGGPELPLFTDGNSFYTGAINSNGPQSLGLAGRIKVNDALAADPSKLVFLTNTTAVGDTTRPDFILDRLTNGTSLYPPDTGFGTSGAPYQSTLLNFSQQIVAAQGAAASTAKQIADGQDVVVNTLQQKAADTSSVNVDDELSNLLVLQNTYGANARVLSTVKEMFDALLQI